MGDPRRTKNAYQGPRHPWNKERIETEKELTYKYGMTNKKELWKAESKLKGYKDNTKKLIAQTGPQAEKELQQLYKKLQNYGLINAEATADDILGLQLGQLLDRRLQTLVHERGLARTIKQARQFITHGHVTVNSKKMTVPGYLVPVTEEATITFTNASSLIDPEHPERAAPQQATGASSKREATTEKEQEQKPEPVTATEETKEEEKPIEQRIEEDTDNAIEVAEAVEEAEADTIAKDHEEAVEEAAGDKKEEAR